MWFICVFFLSKKKETLTLPNEAINNSSYYFVTLSQIKLKLQPHKKFSMRQANRKLEKLWPNI